MIIIIIIKNVLIIVTLHTKVLQGHFTQINTKIAKMVLHILLVDSSCRKYLFILFVLTRI